MKTTRQSKTRQPLPVTDCPYQRLRNLLQAIRYTQKNAAGATSSAEWRKPNEEVLALALALIMVFALAACGKEYTCQDCGKSTTKAYYDMAAIEEQVMCEDCAMKYWMPLDYNNYRVK